MKATIISNDFYVSRFLMKDLDKSTYKVLFEKQLERKKGSKTLARIKAFFPCKAGNESNLVVFAIENIIVLDYVYRNIGKPKVWLWNPITSMTIKNKHFFLAYVRRRGIDVWTFDVSDAKEYGFHYHCQIHSSSLISTRDFNNGSAFFSGVDKKRLQLLKLVKKDLSAVSLSIDFHIVRDKKTQYIKKELAITTDQYMGFSEYLTRVSSCSVLVDISQTNQTGVTLRVVESLFHNKKLITTNLNVKELDLYHLNNIYIYGAEKRSMADFLALPLHRFDFNLKYRYTLEHLLNEML
ncbi:hypothetical protein [Marinomonas primoryensis]|jgi:hypothetical protein|uniref:hypothetical protein n=1 Tax=Marinomonas primoryensis TaxID=178399 RepID=UPI0037049D35